MPARVRLADRRLVCEDFLIFRRQRELASRATISRRVRTKLALDARPVANDPPRTRLRHYHECRLAEQIHGNKSMIDKSPSDEEASCAASFATDPAPCYNYLAGDYSLGRVN